MLLHTFGDGSVGLPVVESTAAGTGSLVDRVRSEVRRRSCLRLGEEVLESGPSRVSHLHVVLLEYPFDRFADCRMEGKADCQGGFCCS